MKIFVKPYLILNIFLSTSISFAKELPINSVKQDKSHWCWAASCEMVLQYYQVNKNQTDVANWAVGSQNTPLPLYNSTPKLGVNQILENFALIQIGGTFFCNYFLMNDEVSNEIKADRPVVVLGQNGFGTNPTYHILVIIGYDDNPYPDEILFNDPYDGRSYSWPTTDFQHLDDPYGNPLWDWQESLKMLRSGPRIGILDGVLITSTDFLYTEPAGAKTFTGEFIRSHVSYAYANNWDWALSFLYNNNEYVVSSTSYPAYLNLTTSWRAPSFTLPDYTWDYSPDGAVIGKLKLSTIDTDGFYHEDVQDMLYYPQNPYPDYLAYALTSINSPQPEVKVHRFITLQDYSINSGADITFRAGEQIDIKNNVTILNGSISNFIIDPSIR